MDAVVCRAGEGTRGVYWGRELGAADGTVGSVLVVSLNGILVFSRGWKAGFLKVVSEFACLELNVCAVVLLPCGCELCESSLVCVVLLKSEIESWSKIRSSTTVC